MQPTDLYSELQKKTHQEMEGYTETSRQPEDSHFLSSCITTQQDQLAINTCVELMKHISATAVINIYRVFQKNGTRFIFAITSVNGHRF